MIYLGRRQSCHFSMLVALTGVCLLGSQRHWYGIGVDSAVISEDVLSTKGRVRHHHDDSVPFSCTAVLVLGVGTGMRVDQYDRLAAQIVADSSIVALIVDPEPGNMMKTSESHFAALVQDLAVSKQWTDLIPCQARSPSLVLVGGHSASGQAAINALPLLQEVAIGGFVGLSPFKVDDRMTVSVPSLTWGFKLKTCGVDGAHAGKMLYEISNPSEGRIFYEIENDDSHDAPTHCAFADKGCMMVCRSSSHDDWVRAGVGESVKKFVHALLSSPADLMNHTFFDLGMEERIRLLLYRDQVNWFLEGEELLPFAS